MHLGAMMPTVNFSRIDLDLIEPNFLVRLFDVIAKCNARGAEYYATAGYRTYGEQMALWAKGRTVKGKIVTNAKGGESAHNFGIAVDFVRDLDVKTAGIQPGWATDDYKVLREEVELAGLHSGAGYRDWPHVALVGFVTGAELKPLDVTWRSMNSALPDLTRLKELWKGLPHG